MKKALRKTLAFGVVFLLMGSMVFASQWEWGLKGGIVRSKAGFSRDLPYITIENLDTFSIGSFLSFFFVKNQLGIQPEIHYAVKGFDVLEEDFGQEISSKYKISYVEIPILIAYKLPVKGRVEPGLVFGPYLGFAHKVMEIQTAFGNTEKRELDDNLKKTDFGLVFGTNVRYRLGSMNVILSVRYSLGLVNISNNIMGVSYDFNENDTIKNRALTISLGVAFIPVNSR
jgi:hypothetical protein